MTTSLFLGISTSIFFKLCSRAPRIIIVLSSRVFTRAEYNENIGRLLWCLNDITGVPPNASLSTEVLPEAKTSVDKLEGKMKYGGRRGRREIAAEGI